jgi:hypothetical protein
MKLRGTAALERTQKPVAIQQDVNAGHKYVGHTCDLSDKLTYTVKCIVVPVIIN